MISLSKHDLENIKNYRYQTNGLTPVERYVYNHFWTFLADYCIPSWLAPNALTLLGLLVPLIQISVIGYLSVDFSQTLPHWVWLLCFSGLFWYQTIDAIDGKHARNTNNCSPLGQLLDHNLDQISFTVFMCSVAAALRVEDNIWHIMAITPGVMSAHYSIEYRTHFTKWHMTVVGLIGATEQLIFVQSGMLFAFFAEKANAVLEEEIDVGGFTFDGKQFLIFFSLVTGVHFNLENMYHGFVAAENKKYALICCLPYAQFFGMLFISSYSQFFKQYVFWFVVVNGLFLTYVTGIFNLNSTAQMKFNYFFLDPILYASLIYVDAQKLVNRETLSLLYLVYSAQLLLKYLLFMTSVIR